MKLHKFVSMLAGLLLLVSVTAQAGNPVAGDDNWGCEVLLCLSNPKGPTDEPKCKPPIEKLWWALSTGWDFPTCDMGSDGAKNHGNVRWAGVGFCPEFAQHWSVYGTVLNCDMQGAVEVVIDGKPWSRIWFGSIAGSSATWTEYSGGIGQGMAPIPQGSTGPSSS